MSFAIQCDCLRESMLCVTIFVLFKAKKKVNYLGCITTSICIFPSPYLCVHVSATICTLIKLITLFYTGFVYLWLIIVVV